VSLRIARGVLARAVRGVGERADDLARLLQKASESGFTVRFNINGQLGACDVFNVFKLVPVDLRSAAN